ncbi:SDR family oxidoreductase [Patulibacter defluvii]|uniref:SDR family oxidoreductase n=1 Tax=Patulibacter defluvii TaxID=3095358 RepID=UPI002A74897B|nr:NAD(P)H-binding protein [Patulibacter sp. DM4]
MTIAILGGSGRIGAPLARELADRGVDARLLVRDPGRGDLPLPAVRGDLRDRASLATALTGCRGLFLLTPHGPEQEAHERAAVDAALAAGVERIVKVSGCAASLSPNGPTAAAAGHWRTERLIERSGVPFAFLRPAFLLQNLLDTVAPIVARTGALIGPFADEPIAMVDARDVAACAAALLVAPTPGDDAHALTGPAPVTHRQIAAALDARLLRLPLPLVARALRRRGGSAWEREHQLRMARFYASGAEGGTTAAVRALTGRPPRDLAGFLAEHADAFTGTSARHAPAPALQETPS